MFRNRHSICFYTLICLAQQTCNNCTTPKQDLEKEKRELVDRQDFIKADVIESGLSRNQWQISSVFYFFINKTRPTTSKQAKSACCHNTIEEERVLRNRLERSLHRHLDTQRRNESPWSILYKQQCSFTKALQYRIDTIERIVDLLTHFST